MISVKSASVEGRIYIENFSSEKEKMHENLMRSSGGEYLKKISFRLSSFQSTFESFSRADVYHV